MCFMCRYGREIFTPNLGFQLILFGIAAISFLRCGFSDSWVEGVRQGLDFVRSRP